MVFEQHLSRQSTFNQYGERVDEPYSYEKRFCVCWLSRLVTEWILKEEPPKDGRLLLQVLEYCVEKVAFHNVEFSSKLCDKCGLKEPAMGWIYGVKPASAARLNKWIWY